MKLYREQRADHKSLKQCYLSHITVDLISCYLCNYKQFNFDTERQFPCRVKTKKNTNEQRVFACRFRNTYPGNGILYSKPINSEMKKKERSLYVQTKSVISER